MNVAAPGCNIAPLLAGGYGSNGAVQVGGSNVASGSNGTALVGGGNNASGSSAANNVPFTEQAAPGGPSSHNRLAAGTPSRQLPFTGLGLMLFVPLGLALLTTGLGVQARARA